DLRTLFSSMVDSEQDGPPKSGDLCWRHRLLGIVVQSSNLDADRAAVEPIPMKQFRVQGVDPIDGPIMMNSQVGRHLRVRTNSYLLHANLMKDDPLEVSPGYRSAGGTLHQASDTAPLVNSVFGQASNINDRDSP